MDLSSDVPLFKKNLYTFKGNKSFQIVLPQPFQEMKETLLPLGEFFHFRVDTFSEDAWCPRKANKKSHKLSVL